MRSFEGPRRIGFEVHRLVRGRFKVCFLPMTVVSSIDHHGLFQI